MIKSIKELTYGINNFLFIRSVVSHWNMQTTHLTLFLELLIIYNVKNRNASLYDYRKTFLRLLYSDCLHHNGVKSHNVTPRCISL